ncbi:MAG: ATP synthase subunit I [Burkholderiales bacterium]|nr:ATP synthase subunit I [Nitrosomonas sp.]MCP5273557.1 ATP synthase subunit I [Burkholderiales bacterium]
MHDLLYLVLMFLCGVVLGGIYFFGLWFTVQRIHNGKHPVFWLISSMAVRMILLLLAFYLILSYGNWIHLLAVLAGFVVLRMIYTRRVRSQVAASAQLPSL